MSDIKRDIPYFNDKDVYDIEIDVLLEDGGVDKLKSQYKVVSRKLDCFSAENRDLQKRIAELESKETKSIDDCNQLSIEWYDNRHQSDCIRINQLNVALDVMTEKYQRLRELKGL